MAKQQTNQTPDYNKIIEEQIIHWEAVIAMAQEAIKKLRKDKRPAVSTADHYLRIKSETLRKRQLRIEKTQKRK